MKNESKDTTPRPDQPVEIAGAGLSGLTAAITLAHRGRRVVVHERGRDAGSRFHEDFQGLENWTSATDVLDELAGLGIEPDFEHTPFREVVLFGPSGQSYRFTAERPIFYLVRRGIEPGTLDQALKAQALAAGAELRFKSKVRHLRGGGVAADGPHRADAVAAGYLFRTGAPDGAYVAVSERLAPKGYAYLLICRGRATLASCLFADFHNERRYVERAVAFFREHVGVEPEGGVRFGGAGNFGLPPRRHSATALIRPAGENAGFQDALLGFGMRYAVLSGAAAGRSLAEGEDSAWPRTVTRRLHGEMAASIFNRWVYERLGDRGYEHALRYYHGSGRDAIRCPASAYAARPWKPGPRSDPLVVGRGYHSILL